MSTLSSPCRPEDLFEVSPAMPAEDVEVLSAYLARFAAPVVRDGRRHCVHCGATIDSMMGALGLGAAFRWGLVHGKGVVTCCSAPVRGCHHITRPDGSVVAEFGTFFLEYLPREVAGD